MPVTETKKHIQKGVSLSDKSFKTKLASNFCLTVYLNSDQLVYAVTDILSRKLLHLQSWSFFNILNPEEYNNTLKQMIASDELLALGYGKTDIYYLSDCFTLVPENLFDKSNAKELLQFNQLSVEVMIVKNEKIAELDAVMVYGINKDSATILGNYFKNGNLKHASVSWIEFLLAQKLDGEFLHCYVQPTTIQIAFVKNNQLKFFNIYTYKTPEDFIFYLMNVVNQLGLDQDKTPLLFSGEVIADSAIYKLAYKYVRDIQFAQRPKWIQVSDEMNFAQHFYLNLFFNKV
jgi:hypothetical protein